MNSNEFRSMFQALRDEIERVIVGQPDLVEQVLVALLARGHVLVEGVPGLGKTLLARALAAVFGVQFKRIQFTPDLMPTDITGAMSSMPSGRSSCSSRVRCSPSSCWLTRSTVHRPRRSRLCSRRCRKGP